MSVLDEEWDQDGNGVDLVVQEGGQSVAGTRIAIFLCHAPEDCTEVERARLAAAAPDLYRALVSVVESGAVDWLDKEIMNPVHAALRKARGEE